MNAYCVWQDLGAYEPDILVKVTDNPRVAIYCASLFAAHDELHYKRAYRYFVTKHEVITSHEDDASQKPDEDKFDSEPIFETKAR